MEQITMDNDKVLIKPIFTNPTTTVPIINPHTNLPYASTENFSEHPYRALVVYAPEVFHNGGYEYPSNIKAGDIVYLPGEVLFLGNDFIIMQGVAYPAIRYSGIIGHRTPTKAEVDSLVFKTELLKGETEKPEVAPKPVAQA